MRIMSVEEQLQIDCTGVSDDNQKNRDIKNYDYGYNGSDSAVSFLLPVMRNVGS